MRYTWPEMFTYCKNMISKCAGCRLANATVDKKSQLLFSFPVEGPMMVLHVDIYTVGATILFAGDKSFLIASCGMTTFSCCEPVPESNSTTFAQAIMAVMLRHGFAHTLVLDWDSKFFATF